MLLAEWKRHEKKEASFLEAATAFEDRTSSLLERSFAA
jgi:hypothetical protein